jgi:hypothetical protein
VAQQCLRVALVQHLEARRDARLQREALEQRLAEGMDGQDVDAARRVEHAREQAAGDDTLGRFGRAVDQLADFLVQLGVRHHGPAAELPGQPVAHLGRGGLGEGETEDALGLDAIEQQARDAIGQHLGLAGAGIGFDPGRMAGRRRAPLRVGGERQGVESGVEDAHSSSPPAVDHSATRSRCS